MYLQHHKTKKHNKYNYRKQHVKTVFNRTSQEQQHKAFQTKQKNETYKTFHIKLNKKNMQKIGLHKTNQQNRQ